jgi:hypothetical protein
MYISYTFAFQGPVFDVSIQPMFKISCQKTKYQPNACILRISKFEAYLWISYFFDDITTFLGFKNLPFVGYLKKIRA